MSFTAAGRRVRHAIPLALMGALVAAQMVFAPTANAALATLNVNTLADTGAAAGACGDPTRLQVPATLSLREAICLTENGIGEGDAAINLPAGTYTLTAGPLQVSKDGATSLAITGAGRTATVIDAAGTSRIFDLDPNHIGGVTTHLRDLTLRRGFDASGEGGGAIIGGSHGSVFPGTLTLDNVKLDNNRAGGATPGPGGAVKWTGGNLSVTNSLLERNAGTASNTDGGGAISYTATNISSSDRLEVTGSTFADNIVTAPAGTETGGGAIYATTIPTPGNGHFSGTYTVTSSRFEANSVTGVGKGRGGALIARGGHLTMTESTLYGNGARTGTDAAGQGSGGGFALLGATAEMHYNRFASNGASSTAGPHAAAAAGHISAPPPNLSNNWWGCNSGPSTTCQGVVGEATTTPWLMVRAAAAPSTLVGPNATTTVTASMAVNSSNQTIPADLLTVFDGMSATFVSTPANTGTSVSPATSSWSGGTVSTTFNSNNFGGSLHVGLGMDQQTAWAGIFVAQAPAITSSAHHTSVAGVTTSFPITTTGSPTPSVTKGTGTIPPGMFFISGANPRLEGKPTAAGTWTFNIVATNSAGSTTQPFTHTVTGTAPEFTSPEDVTFTAGTASSFTITTTGNPASAITRTGTLPSGLTFTDRGNGTAAVSGTPAPGTGGSYPLQLTATNGADPAATQTLNVVVNAAPLVTSSPQSAKVNPGAQVEFTAAATSHPGAEVTWFRSTDGGLTYTDLEDTDSPTLTVPAVTLSQDGERYRARFTNAHGTATTSAAVLNVGTAPVFLSEAQTTFATGELSTHTIAVSGTPNAVVTGQDLPAWLTVTDNSDGTATLAGTPPAGAGGTYEFTLSAANGYSPTATQDFTLTVVEAPVFTSTDQVTFTTDTANNHEITTTGGYPAPTTLYTLSWMPQGLALTDHGDGTATLSGNPGSASAGTYVLWVVATNGPTARYQALTVTIHDAPTLTSQTDAAFTIGEDSTFALTTDGTPDDATFVAVNDLPEGLELTNTDSGDATISGTPAPGTAGTYDVTLTATNSAGLSTKVDLILTVAKKSQTVAVTSTPPSVVGSVYDIAAEASSGLPPAFALSGATTNQACTLADDTLTLEHAGTCVVTVTQPGNGTYAAAPPLQHSFNVNAIGTNLAVTASAASVTYGQDVTATAVLTASSGVAAGHVLFSLDGNPFGGPHPVTSAADGSVTVTLTGPDGAALAPGEHSVVASFAPGDSTTHTTAASNPADVLVAQAATTSAVRVNAASITSTVSVTAPGSGTPSGEVVFSVGQNVVGTALLVDGTAALNYAVPAGKVSQVSASYAGDTNFTGSSDSMTRSDPTITAKLTSGAAKTSHGWYRAPVTVTFTCATNGAKLTEACPAPVTFKATGARQSVTKTISATDGGTATVTVTGINIDSVKPTAKVTGVRAGGVYNGPPKAGCAGTDAHSGIATCVLSRSQSGNTVSYRVTATDKAGNSATAAGTYRVKTIWIAGAAVGKARWQLQANKGYTLVVLSPKRPTMYYATKAPKVGTGRHVAMRAAGKGRWVAGIAPNARMARTNSGFYNLGVKVKGAKMVKVRMHVRR